MGISFDDALREAYRAGWLARNFPSQGDTGDANRWDDAIERSFQEFLKRRRARV